MTPEEKKKMLRLFKSHPILTSDGACIKQMFQHALRSAVEDMHPELTEFERVEIFSETLLEVEALIVEINGKTTTTLH